MKQIELALPPWVVIHVPHDSDFIPAETRRQFLLSDEELRLELLRMTDHFTLDLFAGSFPAKQIVRSSVSRLVVDVERFESDDQEPMAARGMGAVYWATSGLERLREPVSADERNLLLGQWYYPHHQALEDAVEEALAKHGRALVIDAHSFPSKRLPYEDAASEMRPEICIGTDDFHSPAGLTMSFQKVLTNAGFDVAINTPFSGALVPLRHHRKDARVQALMLEVRRDLYMNETAGSKLDTFDQLAASFQAAVVNVSNRQVGGT